MANINVLTVEEVKNNKERFISLINSIGRESLQKELLVNKLNNSDFFHAPASTQYHNVFKGGLCKHSLQVYDNLVMLVNQCGLQDYYSEDTLKIVALLHDLSKMNQYELAAFNTKVYSDGGSKYDSLGRFDWTEKLGYKMKDAEDRFLYGTHCENSLYMIKVFVKLSIEEEVAILYHHAGADKILTYIERNEQSSVMVKYPLSALLHMADYLATFVHENPAYSKMISQTDEIPISFEETPNEQNTEGTTN